MTLELSEKHFRFNWFDYSKFYDFISEKQFKVLVELGAWKGHSISYLAEKNRNSEIYAVDLWEISLATEADWIDINHPRDERYFEDYIDIKKIYNEYLEYNNTRHLINDIQEEASRASRFFYDEEVDFVFIDLWAKYDETIKTLKRWYPKIKKGGILSGHDYNTEGVSKAVTEFFNQTPHDVKVMKSEIADVWWIEK